MSKLSKFFADGFKDQLAMQGEMCVIENKIKRTTSESFSAVITQKTGETEVEIGEITYTVTAHALIPNKFSVKELISNRLKSIDAEFIIVSAVKDISQDFYSCDLVRI